ncbi:MAG: hypothetical protein GTN64_08190, partial [Candidatus Latescibacteria bacterium]|nr:hypothetical protein [Candidatus Latescibacterota bacterium]NIO78580.1 hypothetical protein [Candidatus Latescibacterota bacterium]
QILSENFADCRKLRDGKPVRHAFFSLEATPEDVLGSVIKKYGFFESESVEKVRESVVTLGADVM